MIKTKDKITIDSLKLFDYVNFNVNNIANQYASLGKENRNGDSYTFIPSNTDYIRRFVNIILKHKIHKNANILDAGCGVSPMLISLNILGYSSLYGYDIDKMYINKLHSIIPSANLKQRDLFTANYSMFDIIYSYMPIANYEKCVSLYEYIFESMKPGAILVDFYGPIEIAYKKFSDRAKACFQDDYKSRISYIIKQ